MALTGTLVAVGAGLAAIVPSQGFHCWYLCHAVFLLPVFGDGRSVIVGARAWSARIVL
ncbi:hypothetical protein [Leifsonia xyli]|uniref:hypothetical protein n=1 Tax=Leifsonia xyli TaxID=1575 RepID=UPI0002F873E2|nr:hypothetical protein [Leifsonia xyli]